MVKNLTKEHYENYKKIYNDLVQKLEKKATIDEDEAKKELIKSYNVIKSDVEQKKKWY